MKQSLFNIIVPIGDEYLLYNTLYKGIIKLDKEHLDYFNIFNGKNIKDIEHQLVEAFECFCDNNFLIDDDANELSVLQYEYNKNAFDHTILTLTIAPTLLCNFKCPYCYETPQPGIFGDTEINAIINFVMDKFYNDNFKKLKINWYGGEPMLAIKQIKIISEKLIAFCNKHHIEYSANMVSNGSLIDEANAKLLKALNIMTVQITLDGLDEMQDIRRPARNGKKMVSKIIAGMKHMDNLGITVSCRVNVDRININEYYRIEEYFKDYPNINVHAGHLRDYNNLPKEDFDCYSLEEFGQMEHEAFMQSDYTLNDLEKILMGKKVFCGAYTENNYVIDQRCNVYKCWNDIGDKNKIIFNLIQDKDTRTINFKPLIEYMCYNPFTDEECSKCNLLPLCVGGCFYERKIIKHPFCYSTKYGISNYILKYYEEIKKNGSN